MHVENFLQLWDNALAKLSGVLVQILGGSFMVTKDMTIGEILNIDEGLIPILLEMGMHCLGCPASQMESLEEACDVHGTDVNMIVDKMNSFLAAK